MSFQAKLKRFLLIIEKTQSKAFYPTAQEIVNFIEEHGIPCSMRTFERDKDQLRNEFDLDIRFVEKYDGYHFFSENSTNVNALLQILMSAVSSEAYLESFKDYKSVSNILHVEANHVELHGIHYLKTLLRATREHRIIEFNHENFWTQKQTHYEVCPYLLKEYQNRWYIVGTITNTDTVLTFGIDRIHDLKVQCHFFEPDESLDIRQRFENIIGVTYSETQPEEVQLEFTEFQAKYIQTKRLHHTQNTEKQGDKIIVSLYLIPNHELKQRILMYGANVKVLKPNWLKKEITTEIKSMLKSYS